MLLLERLTATRRCPSRSRSRSTCCRPNGDRSRDDAAAEAGVHRRSISRGEAALLPRPRAPVRPARPRGRPRRPIAPRSCRGSGFSRCRRDCRIFQQKTVPDIVKKVFNDCGVTDVQREASPARTPRATTACSIARRDLAFMSRLLEEEGIFYFFEHTDKAHARARRRAGGGEAGARVEDQHDDRRRGGARRTTSSRRSRWSTRSERQGHARGLQRHGAEAKLESTIAGSRTALGAQRELRLSRESSPSADDGDALAGCGWRIGVARAHRSRRRTNYRGLRQRPEGESPTIIARDVNQCVSLALGCTTRRPSRRLSHQRRRRGVHASRRRSTAFRRPCHYRPAARHAEVDRARHADGGRRRPGGRGDLRRQVWPREGAVLLGPRRARRTRRARAGCACRALGRQDSGASSTFRASARRSIVDFLEGDPDRPIITGRVYNAEQMPPYDAAGQQTQSGLKIAQLARAAHRRTSTSSASRTRRAAKRSTCTPRRTSTRSWRTTRRAQVGARPHHDDQEQRDEDGRTKGTTTTTITKGNQTLTVAEGNQTITVSGRSDDRPSTRASRRSPSRAIDDHVKTGQARAHGQDR